MEEIASVYARSLFEVALEQGKLDDVRDQLGEFADALDSDQQMQVFFFSPYFSTPEKVEGLDKVVTGAEPILQNFLKLLIEKSRMPAVFRVRRTFDELWQRENKLLPVEITSAIELDKTTVKQIGDRIGEETGQKIELSRARRPGHPRRAHRPRRQLDHRLFDPRPPRLTS